MPSHIWIVWGNFRQEAFLYQVVVMQFQKEN